MIYLPETQYLIETYDITSVKWAHKLVGQDFHLTKFDFYKMSQNVPKDATDGADFILNQIPGCLSYDADTNGWFVWNGLVHTPLTASTVPMQLIDILGYAFKDIDTFLGNYIENRVAQIKVDKSGPDADKAIAKVKAEVGAVRSQYEYYAKSLHSNKGVKDTLDTISRRVAKPREHFQNDNAWFVVRNGVIDIEDYRKTRVVTLLPHSATRPVYRYFDADFDPSVSYDQYGTWRKYLASSIIDWDTVLLLQKAVGAAFSAEAKPRALFNLLGAPASGKSVFLSVFNKLGQDYSVMPNNQAIQANNGDTNFYQDDLRGARFVGFSEVQGKKALDDGFVKGVLGGDEQTTRKIRQHSNKWKPQCVLFIASNMALKFNTRDEATFVKILPIPFPHSFTEIDPDHKMDRELENKVMAERNGILHWVLEGMTMFWDEGLHPTEAVLAAMDGNKTANSSALQFMSAMEEAGYITQNLDAPLSTCLPMKQAYEMFKVWADEQGINNVPLKTTFNDDVADFYHGKKKSGVWTFEGLQMSNVVQANVQNPIQASILARAI